MNSKQKRILILFFIVFWLLLGFLNFIGFFEPLELKSYDISMELASPGKPNPDIVIVAVDDLSMQVLKEKWPWSRKTFAEAVREISTDSPSVVALDFTFSEPGSIEEDSYFERILNQNAAVPVICGMNLASERQEDKINGKGLYLIQKGLETPVINGLKPGFINLPADSDGLIRRAMIHRSFLGQNYDSFPLLIAKAYLKHKALADFKNPFLIAYPRRDESFSVVSFYQVLHNMLGKGFFKDKIVLIGATFNASQDFHLIPGSKKIRMSGVEINAHIVNTLIRAIQISQAGLLENWIVFSLIYAVLCLIILSQFFRIFYWPSLLIGVVYLFFYILMFLVFDRHYYLFFPLGALILFSILVQQIVLSMQKNEMKEEMDEFQPEQLLLIETFCKKHSITPREKEIILLILKNYNNPRIAKKLYITINTVKRHITNIYQKLGIQSREELASKIKEKAAERFH